MTNKFQNKYRISSARAAWWNYGSKAAYFITICTKNRQHYFGEIENNEMRFSAIGKIAAQEWYKTPFLRPDMNLELDESIVMPNHFHGIIWIGENDFNRGFRRDAMHGVSTEITETTETTETKETNTQPNQPVNNFGPQSKNLASIVRGYKSAVTTFARKNNIDFAWQSRFHDHIIRNEDEYQRIKNYIANNPKNWSSDKFYDSKL